MTYASRNLQGDLQDLALRMDISGQELLTGDVSDPGKWILLSSLNRMEAGEFHNLAGRPDQLRIARHPWKIRVVEATVQENTATAETETAPQLPEETESMLRNSLDFVYAHEAATMAPSKQTATQRKGRQKDQEAAEDTEEPPVIHRSWKKPAFRELRKQGKAYGSAAHSALQYITYAACTDAQAVRREVEDLVSRRLLTKEQGELVDCDAIAAFFQTEIGKKLRAGAEHIREFKFSILDDGSNYGPNLAGEQVLLQGVVDCALIEEDGITVLDFKTDAVKAENLPDLTERYRDQVLTYVQALERIYQKPVKAAYLYFFALGEFVSIR
jgi:ATP-dependent helicase/nuclease subunit A